MCRSKLLQCQIFHLKILNAEKSESKIREKYNYCYGMGLVQHKTEDSVRKWGQNQEGCVSVSTWTYFCDLRKFIETNLFEDNSW